MKVAQTCCARHLYRYPCVRCCSCPERSSERVTSHDVRGDLTRSEVGLGRGPKAPAQLSSSYGSVTPPPRP
jgi:hypothetical protein